MKRWLPSPLLSVGLLLMWLLLNQTLEPGHWLLGGLLGIVAPLLARPLQPHGYAQLRRPLALLRLMGFFDRRDRAVLLQRLPNHHAAALGQCEFTIHPRAARPAQSAWSGFALVPDQYHPRNRVGGSSPRQTRTAVARLRPARRGMVGWDTIKSRYERPIMEVF
jgi:hypothetical protein